MKPVISVWLDKRREKNDSTYPVRIQVFYNGIRRYYLTGIDLTEDGFEKSYLTEKPRGKHSDNKDLILIDLAKAKRIAGEVKPFSFERFEKLFREKEYSTNDVFHQYKETIKNLDSEERVKTGKNYSNSQNSLKAYLKFKGKKEDKLYFESITVSFLNDYERWMVKEGKSPTTIGIYLRPLRALFNAAIDAEEIDKSLYPFGKKRYVIPGGKKVKKALSKTDLKKLFEQPLPDDSPMTKARAFWFFSYQCSGINMVDIAQLKRKDITGSSIVFIRNKTRRTTKSDPKPIIVTLTQGLRDVIDKYSSPNLHKDAFVFPILNHSMDAKERVRAVEGFTRFVNQHIKQLAKLAGVDPTLSTYGARHSYATIAIQSGASKEYVQQQLGHGSVKTTENYFAGFEDSVRNVIDNKLMDFSDIKIEDDSK